MVVLAEDKEVQDRLLKYDLKMQTIKEVSTAFHVYQANILSFLFNHLGDGRNVVLCELTHKL